MQKLKITRLNYSNCPFYDVSKNIITMYYKFLLLINKKKWPVARTAWVTDKAGKWMKCFLIHSVSRWLNPIHLTNDYEAIQSGPKNVPLYFCSNLRQLLTIFKIFSLAHSADNLQ